jgi:Flp pilus assembly pilin Flp
MSSVVRMHPQRRASHFARLCAFDEAGATSIEYGLIAMVLSISIAGAMTVIGSEVIRLFEFVSGRFPD